MKNKHDKTPFGVAIGLLFCGLFLIGFPHMTGMVAWAAWICYLIGLILVLVGILGSCIEVAKRRE